VVVVAEIQVAQTAKEASRSDAVTDSVGDADATNTAGSGHNGFGTSEVAETIFSKEQNLTSIEKSRQD
jgi:hypothetical protein